jgi:hypothetical protein
LDNGVYLLEGKGACSVTQAELDCFKRAKSANVAPFGEIEVLAHSRANARIDRREGKSQLRGNRSNNMGQSKTRHLGYVNSFTSFAKDINESIDQLSLLRTLYRNVSIIETPSPGTNPY